MGKEEGGGRDVWTRKRAAAHIYIKEGKRIMKIEFAHRMKQAAASEIRETLKLIADKEMISFAGGNPDPATFPVDVMGQLIQAILKRDGGMALQYSPTEGYDPLRQKIAERLVTYGINAAYEDLLITSGSQQALSLTGDVFLNDGDVVVCENPTYFGAMNAFRKYRPRIVGIGSGPDGEGMDLEELGRTLKKERVKCIYVIPDYQNPTGNSWPAEKRRELAELSASYEVPVVEDNPYYEIYYDEKKKKPTIKHFDKAGNVIFLGSYSKTFCPGLRIGFINAAPDILNKYVIMKQGADLQTNTLGQRLLNEFLETVDFEEHVKRTRELYRSRRDLMAAMLAEHFPEQCKYMVPDGGFFIWVELPQGIDGKELLARAIKNKVAFISGQSFYTDCGRADTIRLSYSTMPEERIREGMKRLGAVLNEMDSQPRCDGCARQ